MSPARGAHPMSLPMQPSGAKAWPEQPHHWVNSEGLGLRLQCFLVVRDADRRIACVRLKEQQGWFLPGESFRPNEAPDDAARRVSTTWFGVDLQPRVAGFQSYPDHGDGKWYVIVLYEAQVPKGGLKVLEDTAEIAFAPAGKAPGPFAMSHADVFERLGA